MKPLPEWMRRDVRVNDRPDSVAPARVHGRTPVRKALGSFAGLIGDIARNDAIAARAGLLQGVDARAKVLGLISLIVAVTLVRSIPALAVCYVVCASMACASQVPARRLARAWLMALLFSVPFALPAVLNVVTDGNRVLTICHFADGRFGPWRAPDALAVTDAGLMVAGRFVLRAAVCVSLGVLLTVTTPTARLFRGLRALGVPRLFIVLLTMMERYLGVIARSAEEIHLARISRSIHSGSLRQEQAWVAAGMGSLFRRTQSLGQQVYLAMLSRGYTGEVYLMEEPRWRRRDWVFLGTVAGFVAALLMWFRTY